MPRKTEIRHLPCARCGEATVHHRLVRKQSLLTDLAVDSLLLLLTCGLALVILLPLRIFQGIQIGVDQATTRFVCSRCGNPEEAAGRAVLPVAAQPGPPTPARSADALDPTEAAAALAAHTGHARIHIAGRTTCAAASGIRAAVGLPPSEAVLALVDLSGIGNRDLGLVITDTHLRGYTFTSDDERARVVLTHATWAAAPIELEGGGAERWLHVAGRRLALLHFTTDEDAARVVALLASVRALHTQRAGSQVGPA